MSCLPESSSSLARSVPAENAALNSLLRSSNVRGHDTVGTSASHSATSRANQSRNEASTTMPDSAMGGSGPLVSTNVQSYFQHLESRQCRTSSVGPSHTLRVEQRLPILRSDGQDSGVEDLGMAGPSSPAGSDVAIKTNLTQKEFMVYRRALLCAQFPVLSSPQPSPSPQETSPYSYPLSPSTSSQSTAFTYLTSRKPQARLTPDKVSLAGDCGIDGRSDEESEEDLLVQNEMLAGLVRGAFQLTEERHQYYDEVITEGTGRKAPARILIEELVSRLSVVENNRHPFYNPQAFESRAYDVWQQNERRHIGQLIETFWQFSLPSPVSTMVKSSYWQSVHDEYQDLMIRLIRLDKRLGVNNYSSAMLSSTSRRLLKEFGLRYGVGELYRRIVFLDYLANKDHFECEVWYMEFILKELSRLSSQLPSMAHQTRFVMVRHEFELLLDILNKLHEHSKHGLQGLLLSSPVDCSHKSVALVSLLSSVLTLKVQLSGRKGFSLEHYLEGYIKESARQGYHRHKLRLEAELNINTYVSPITAELVSKLIGCVQEDVKLCMDHYQSVFSRYNQNIVKLVTTTFYSNLMTDVNLVCDMSDINKKLNSIDQEFLALSQKLSELDVIWKEFIPCHAQQWRQPMLIQAKSWLKIMTKQLTHLVINVVNTDQFQSEFGKDLTTSAEEMAEPRPRQSSILRHSPFSAFKAVNTSRESSPDRVKGHKTVGSESEVGSKSRKSPSQKSKTEGTGDSPDSVLYLNGSKEVRRIHSLPDLADHTPHDSPKGLRRNATTSDLEQSSQIRVHDIDAGVVRFSPTKHHSDDEDLDCDKEKHSTDDVQNSRLAPHGGELSESGSEVSSCHLQTETDPTTTVENNNDVLKLSTTETGSLDIYSSGEQELSSRTSDSSSSERGQEGGDPPSEVVTPRSDVTTQLGSNGSPEIEVLTESGLTDSGGKDHAPLPGVELPGDSSILSSSAASSAGSSIHDQSTSTRESRGRSATVSFKSKHLEFIEPESTRPDGFSSSLVDVMFMSQRAISFMQKLIGILCPADLEVPVGPDNDFTGSMSIRTFWERMRRMKVELKEITEETIIKLVCLYANNLLAMDLCAAEKDQVNSLVNEKVLYGVLLNRQESMLSRCRHERESQLPCDYYTNRDTALLCDKHEPVTRQMCVRINNTWSVLCLLPQLADMLQSRLRGRSLSSPSDDQYPNGIYDEPMDHGMYEKSSLAHGDHHAYLHNVLQAQINLLAYKLNLILQEALHVLLSPEFDQLSIADRLQPLTSCLRDHWVSLGQWLTPHCLMLFMNRLWLYLVEDFKTEVEGLRLMKENADSQAMLLSQSISHLIEFLHAKGEGLGIDQLVKPAEHVLNMLQLHSLSSKHLIQLYRKQLLHESESDSTAEPLPREVLQNMYQALHRHRKCFSGDHLVMWLLVHYYEAKDQPSSRKIKYKHKAKQVGQKLLDLGFIEPVISRSYAIPELLQNELAGLSSDGSVTDATPYPAVTIHSYPKSSISRRSQELGNDSSEDSLESSGRNYRQSRRKRRISDFYSEEMDSSDDSSTSKSEDGIRRTIVLKADVHVSAEADPNEAGDRKENDASSQEQLKDEEDVARSGGEQKEKQSVPSESHSNGPSRKGHRDPSSGADTPFSPTSAKESLHQQSAKNSRPSGSRHFTPDSHHFYYFCDVDDQLMNSSSSSGDSTGSFPLGDGQRQTKRSASGEKPHPHIKSQVINADFILGILMCRRKQSQVAKNFTRTVPNEYWKEDDSSCLCCSCFR